MKKINKTKEDLKKEIERKKNKDMKLLIELGKYLKRKGWECLIIGEEGIIAGDIGNKNSFRLSFKFIGKKIENEKQK